MSACLIKAHHAGLFSLINNVITCRGIYDEVYVDWRAEEGCLYGEKEDGNVYLRLFEGKRAPEEAGFEGDIITNYPHQLLTYKNAGLLYQADRLLGWRKRLNSTWEHMHARHGITLQAEEFFTRMLRSEPFVSAIIRAGSHAGEQENDRSQTLDEYAAAIESNMGEAKRVFVMGDKESIAWLSHRFPVVFYPDDHRPETRATDRHLAQQQTVEQAKQCIVEVMLASWAQTMVHGISNMATCALIMNPAMKSVYLR